MTDESRETRRTVLKYAGSALALPAAGTVHGGSSQRYVAVTDGDATGPVERRGFTVTGELADGEVLIVRGPRGGRTRLASTPGVTGATADVVVDDPEGAGAIDATERAQTASETTDEPAYDRQWDKQRTAVPAAHRRTTGDGARIAVLDTGIDTTHPDLSVNTDLSAIVKRDDIVYDDDVRDSFGHGTHVAGIAAASNDNDAGIAGVAPDAELVSIRDSPSDKLLSLARRLMGIQHAVDVDADVVCSTLAPAEPVDRFPPQARSGTLATAARRIVHHAIDAGAIVVQSAGNDFTGGNDVTEGGGFMPPGNAPGTIVVSATGPDDERTFYSNYGRGYVDIGAPGGGYETVEKTGSPDVEYPPPTSFIYSTLSPGTPFAERAAGTSDEDRYGYQLGTSMAAPQVAGAAALVRSLAPNASPQRVTQALKHGAEGVRGRGDPDIGAGRLNVAKALEAPQIRHARSD